MATSNSQVFRNKRTNGYVAAAVAAAVTIASPLVSRREGARLDPYHGAADRPNVFTVCTGETRVFMRHYSAAECDAMLARALTADFAPAILACTPELADHPRIFAATISLTYNIGVHGYCGSTVARRFAAHDWRGGCAAFMSWRVANGRVVRGLVARREEERGLCLSGVASG